MYNKENLAVTENLLCIKYKYTYISNNNIEYAQTLIIHYF